MSPIRNVVRSLISRCAVSLFGLVCALLLLAPAAGAMSYSTNFPLAESPISEGGMWINGGANGNDWNNVLTTPGFAFGSDPKSPKYDDPTALLTGVWGPDQTVQATVRSVNSTDAFYEEVELRLRSSFSTNPNRATGYEITWRCSKSGAAYFGMARWNGPLADSTNSNNGYTSLVTTPANTGGSQYGVTNGDVVKATIVGNVISAYLNGVLIATAVDNTFASGNPGIGFNYGCGPVYANFGFTSFSATDGLTSGTPPTVATAAAASPNPVIGTTTALSVLGADDGGEPALTYTWAATGSPPAPVSFSANGTNAAKNATATFAKAGIYTLQATIRDAGGQTVTSSVGVTVNQTLTAIAVAPVSATVVPSGTQTFAATAKDQFAQAMASQPAFAWTVSGGGSISSTGLFTAGASVGGPFTVTAASGSVSGTASVSVSNVVAVTLSPQADAYVNDGGSASTNFGTAPNLITKSDPTAGYARETFLRFDLSALTGSVTGATLRLHPIEVDATIVDAVGLVSNDAWGETTVTWNNRPTAGADTATWTPVLNVTQDVDVTTLAQGEFAGDKVLSLRIRSTGAVRVDYGSKENADPTLRPTLIVMTTTSGGGNVAPTVTAAAASANPVTGSTTALSVLGADDAGEAALTYTWATTGSPPAPVAFSANGTNAAKNATATFSKAGSYTMQVTIRDAGGLTATSSVAVTVNQTLTAIAVAPGSATVGANGTQAFTATASDQFAQVLAAQPALAWTVSGGGTISASGLFTAGSTTGGPFTVTAASGSVIGTASVTISASTTATLAAAADAYVRDSSPTTNFGTATELQDKNAAGFTRFAFLTFDASGASGVTSAKLRLYGYVNTTGTDMISAQIFGVSNTTWSETAITWNNQPTAGATALASVVINGPTPQWYEWDVTAYVQGELAAGRPVVCFELRNPLETTPYCTFNSREAASNQPQLVVSSGSANPAPTVATAAAAGPNPVTGTTTAMSVLGADDAGEAALTYTWAATGTSPAPVAFSANGTNAAKNATATFAKAGSYTLQATIRDAGGATATSSVVVTVNQTLTAIAVSPASATVTNGNSQPFTATASDQFAQVLTVQPTFVWTVAGGGTIASTGVFTATTVGGPFTVTAASGSVNGTASVTVTAVAAFAVKINFQPTTAPMVAGYLVDGGLVFADRGNGYTYGWNVDDTAYARDRNLANSPDQRYDTLIHMKYNSVFFTWEIAVPNGSYQVRIVSYDPAYVSQASILAEGVPVVNGSNTLTTALDGTQMVTVTDGRLTVSNGAITDVTGNKICFIEIIAVPSGGG